MALKKTDSVERLFKAVLSLGTPEECSAFFEDVSKIKEIVDMAQRLDAAFLLDEGENYKTITETIGISTATIGRVSRCLKYGAGGYRIAIDRLKEGEDKK